MDSDLVGTFPPPQMTYGKSFDGFVPLGPCIVSRNVRVLCVRPTFGALTLRTPGNRESTQPVPPHEGQR
jgi:2-keto-4-pentenoate hydratase/2-oxohepta-3-ene-1,7-dioic acid hydratase in catechol pathway